MTPPGDRNDLLFDLYKIAIDEYRFQVKLNWDRMMYYVIFSTALFSAGAGLLKFQGPRVANLLVAAIFLIGGTTSFAAIFAIRKAHQYYQRTIHKKTLLEHHLGLDTPLEGYPLGYNTLAIASTKGQTETMQILNNTGEWLRKDVLRRGSINHLVAWLLGLLSVLHVIGASLAIILFIRIAPQYLPWP